MKKLFTLFFLFALMGGVKADTIVDAVIDYSTWTEWNLYSMGYEPTIEKEHLCSSNPENEEGEPGWYQYFMAPAIDVQPDKTYNVTFTCYGDEPGEVVINFRWSWDADPIVVTLPISDDEEEHTVEVPNYGGNKMDIIFQSGSYTSPIYFSKIVVTHEGKALPPVEWDNLLENGDAEGEYGEVPCAWGKEAKGNPQAATIEQDDSNPDNHVFVVHATAKETDPWDNQFWIMAPHTFAANDVFTIQFRYKASKPTGGIGTQHHRGAGDYLHWEGMGQVTFTTEWQTFTKEITVPGAADGMQSFAFNLNDFEEENDYYFDDIKWGTMVTESGYFIVGDFNGMEVSDALKFEWNEGDNLGGWYQITVGTAENPAKEVKIATRTGSENIYNNNILRVNSEDITDASMPWIKYGSGDAKIILPMAGVWTIKIDEEAGLIRFECPDYTPEEKEPEVIVPVIGELYNIIVNGDAKKDFDSSILWNDQERNYTVCAWAKDSAKEPYPAQTEAVDRAGNRAFICNATDCVTVEEDDVEEEVLDENGDPVLDENEEPITQTVTKITYPDASSWDNQFWIQAPQQFDEGDEFTLKFRYKCNKPKVVTNTQAHLQNPSDYKHWYMIGDVTFTDTWQTFESKVTVSADQSGMWSIAFNLNPNDKTATKFYFADLSITTILQEKGWFVVGDFNDDDYVNAQRFLLNDQLEDGSSRYETIVGTEEKPASYCWISTRRANKDIFNRNRQWVDPNAELADAMTLDDVYDLGQSMSEDAETDEEKEALKKIIFPTPGIWTIVITEDGIAFEKGNHTDPNLVDGIKAPASAAAGVEYYNLSGMRINKPVKGIAIEKRGAQVKKVLF